MTRPELVATSAIAMLASTALAGTTMTLPRAGLHAAPGMALSEPDPGNPFALPGLGNDLACLDSNAADKNKMGDCFSESFKLHVLNEVARQRQHFPEL